MEKFPGYEKIAESLDRWRLEPSAFRTLRKAEWVVTEKIHGANFCIATDGTTLRCANRRDWISPGESFFGYEAVRDSLRPTMQALFQSLQAQHPEMVCLYLYGELFGGGYPHPDVPPTPGVQPIQTGVWYAPDIRFCAFDLRVENAAGEHRYLDYADVVTLCAEAGIFAAAPLFIGKYEMAMAQNNRFDSTVPRALGLPELPPGTNLAEGVVVKPYREIALLTAQGESVRPVLKRKIREFSEDKRYHEATKWEAPAAPVVSSAPPLDLLQWEASCRIVENRRDATASKIGYVAGKTPEKAPLLFRLLADEVQDETQVALPDAWASLSAAGRKTLQEFIAVEVRGLLKTPKKMKATLYRTILDSPDVPFPWNGAIHAHAWWSAMAQTPQDVIHHAEGDVATHTRLVMEAMQADGNWQALPPGERGLLLLTALLHDIGKPETTREENGRITARGHAGRGEVMARRLLWEAGDIPFTTREAICTLIRFHQHPFWLIERDDARYQAIRIAQTARCDHLALLAEADGRGRVCDDQDALLLRVACFREFCDEQRCLASPYPFPSDHSRFLYFRADGLRDPDYHAYEEPDTPELILLSGLPGMGKDTYIRQYLSHLPVVSLDTIRTELKIDWTDNQEPVLDVAREQTRVALRSRNSVVWNATNLSRDLRGKRVRFADDYRARVRIIYVEAPADIQRRQNRTRPERVPESAMERMYRQWQIPDLTEAHTIDWQVRESEGK